MSRHSKWSKIKHQKGAADARKGTVFTKLSRAITIAARDGGDPAANFKLRLVLDSAKASGMTKDTVERAIARGTGEGKEGVAMVEEWFEGFLPGAVAVLIEVVTDNHNRTLQELKHAFSVASGNLGGAGSVAWMFARHGVARISNIKFQNSNELELQLIEAGAQDIVEEDNGITVYTKPEDLKPTEEKIRSLGFNPDYIALEWIAKESVAVDEPKRESVDAFVEELEEREDVAGVYTNTQ